MGEQYVTIDNVYNEMIAQDALKNRRIWFNDEVDDTSCTKAIYYLNKLFYFFYNINIKSIIISIQSPMKLT